MPIRPIPILNSRSRMWRREITALTPVPAATGPAFFCTEATDGPCCKGGVDFVDDERRSVALLVGLGTTRFVSKVADRPPGLKYSFSQRRRRTRLKCPPRMSSSAASYSLATSPSSPISRHSEILSMLPMLRWLNARCERERALAAARDRDRLDEDRVIFATSVSLGSSTVRPRDEGGRS